jgi:YVTN family beta-propeller protein
MEVIDTQSNEVGDSLVLGFSPTRGILTADSSVLYVSDAASGRLMPVDINVRRLRTPISVGQHPGMARFDPNEKILLVVNEGSSDLAVIRVSTGSLITMIPVGYHPNNIAVKLF